MIKVSVIIPIYNMELYLEECLQSVIAQTLKEIEIICVNDGSTDNSLEILQKYASQYSNIVILNQENCGVGKARNRGINIAKGEFVAFMDPDDFYPDRDILECLYNDAKKNNVYICGGSLCSLKNNTIIKDYDGWLRDYTFNCNGKMTYQDYQFFYGFYRFIYHLEFLKKNNLYFPSYIRFQDPPFFVRAMLCAEEFYAMKKITYCYRQGYKKFILTPEKTIDYAKGVIDLLNISKEKKLKKLHRSVIKVLHNILSISIYKHIAEGAEGNTELEELVYQINKNINIQYFQEKIGALQSPFLLEPREIVEFVQLILKKESEFLDRINQYKKIIIYGAGEVGLEVADYLKKVNGIEIICFVVSDKTKNPHNINGIPVKSVHDIIEYKKKALVLIATSSKYHHDIKNVLQELRFESILPINYSEFQLFGTKIKKREAICYG